jgi:AcrR family transcriptional regulator
MPFGSVSSARAPSRRSLVLAAAIVTSVVAALVVALAAVSMWQERLRQRERAAAATQNLARLLEGRVGDVLGRVDMLLRLVVLRVQDQPLPASAELAAELQAMVRAAPVVQRLYLTDAHGQPVGPGRGGADAAVARCGPPGLAPHRQRAADRPGAARPRWPLGDGLLHALAQRGRPSGGHGPCRVRHPAVRAGVQGHRPGPHRRGHAAHP